MWAHGGGFSGAFIESKGELSAVLSPKAPLLGYTHRTQKFAVFTALRRAPLPSVQAGCAA